MPTSGPSLFSMSPKQASLSEKSIGSFPLAAAHPFTVLSWPEALHASGSRRACLMPISRNARSLVALPDFPESAQAVRHGVPGTRTAVIRKCQDDPGLVVDSQSCARYTVKVATRSGSTRRFGKMPITDLSFVLVGTTFPLDDGYSLFSAICRVVPGLHGDLKTAAQPLRGLRPSRVVLEWTDLARLGCGNRQGDAISQGGSRPRQPGAEEESPSPFLRQYLAKERGGENLKRQGHYKSVLCSIQSKPVNKSGQHEQKPTPPGVFWADCPPGSSRQRRHAYELPCPYSKRC